VDFQPFSADPRFCDLIAEHSADHPVHGIDPIAELVGRDTYTPLTAQVSRLTARAAKFIEASQTRSRVAVIGYCSAAALSLRLAASLAETRQVVALLIRPVWPGTAMIGDELRRLRRNLSAEHAVTPDLDGNGDAALRVMTDLLQADIRAMAVSHDIGESDDSLGELLAQYRAWLGFLLSSRDALREPWPRVVPLHVLTDAPDGVSVPWRELSSYAVTVRPAAGSRRARDEELARLALRALREERAGRSGDDRPTGRQAATSGGSRW
jgi:hypothetical protein